MFLDDENEDVVDTTENVEEQTTEQVAEGTEVATEGKNPEEKTYTQADFDRMVNAKVDELLPRKLERARAKIERENAKVMSQYKRMENVLKAGLQTKDTEETISRLIDFYSKQGVEIPQEKASYSDRDIRTLAEEDAKEVIDSGYDEIASEVERLSQINPSDMTLREKLSFDKLLAEKKRQESIKELNKIGVGIEELDSKEYRDFSEKLNPNLSEKDKYEMYLKFKPKKKVEPIGSMKTTDSSKEELKDFYTYEEASKFTRKQLHDNPKLLDIIQKSASQW
jgi:hypothetical protein